ncbi:tRNA nucleotidyltransferase (CCA-adding enzyme) [Ectothiorhodospira magna]|uniref:Multifunctional CCA protein n=1 Tax=Ectothiorhodospira magna TaxID=867345 RepID=A0A1H8ZC41_9GAMM|nr:multifunctional CCA addition/repair protein [Ectothiorhodospira magna]SEP61979.1 tRNA nucleotidyltransferase (CCA-adding enzyme) [Ectothiorhodospira magna]
MDCYLVGGAVRDALLGLPVRERDWVVVGTTVDAMLAQGFKQVGRDFPVFLHPQTREEYALARTERKTAPGYRGFEVHAAPDVTLQDDLERRDLTINAMAQDAQGQLIDPFGGQKDLAARRLRHVSAAFAEDPVRILRVARFAARLGPLGFTVAPETLALMQQMVAAGEVDALVPERVWQELERTLAGPCPSRFFQVLRACGALAVLFPELERLYGVPQPPRYHPEVDTGVHTFMVLDQAEGLSTDPVVRFAALTHDLGKGNTPKDILPSHHGHEQRGVVLVDQLCDRYRIPGRYRESARLVARYHGHIHRVFELRPDTLAKTLEGLDAYRRPDRLEGILLACEADYRGRTGFEDRPYPQADYVRQAHARCLAIQAGPLVAQGLKGQAITQAMRRLRIEALTQLRRAYTDRVPDGT